AARVHHIVQLCAATAQPPAPPRDRVRNPRLKFAPDVFSYNQGDLLLVARQRDEVFDLAQTGDRFPVSFERKAHHGKSRFRQVETNWHKITPSRRKPEPGTSPRRETSRGRSETGTPAPATYSSRTDARQPESPRRAAAYARDARRPARHQYSPNQFRHRTDGTARQCRRQCWRSSQCARSETSRPPRIWRAKPLGTDNRRH